MNDYRKFGLLRCIAESTKLQLGILWLLTEADTRPDGEFRSYLQDASRWQHHDPTLFSSLIQLLSPDTARNVDHTGAWGLLPGASYFNQIVSDSALQRQRFMALAFQELAHCPLLFLDPDNGVEVRSIRYGAKGSCKFVFWRELAALFQRGHSLIIYQHYPRIPRPLFERQLIQAFREKVGAPEVTVFATAHVAFVVALQEAHAHFLPVIRESIHTRWAGQIRETNCVEPPPLDGHPTADGLSS